MRLPYLCILFGLVVALLSGCGSKHGATASGTVTVNGEPLRLGTVAFNPVGSGRPAYGLIDEDSYYSVRTGRELGLPPGDYVVTVVASEPPAEQSHNGGPPPPGDLLTPTKYRDRQSSDLRYTVESGSNEIDLLLEGPIVQPGRRKSRRR